MAWLEAIVDDNQLLIVQYEVKLATDLQRVLKNLRRASKKVGYDALSAQQSETINNLKIGMIEFLTCTGTSDDSRLLLIIAKQAILNYVQYTLLGVQQSEFYVRKLVLV